MKPFGLLGRKLSHSISPEIHNLLCDYEYVLFEREPDELDEFFQKREFSGLNVTIPYKKDVIKYCAELSYTAQKIGSVNTITVRPDGTLYGDNSDYFGFSYMIEQSGIEIKDKTVLVLGTGGASLTVKAVVEDMGAKDIISVSRTGDVNYENVYDLKNADVIVNTTPVGMYPNNGERVIDLSKFNSLSGCLDLIYNPSLTPFLYDAKNLGVPYANGLTMLVAQAQMSAEKFIDSTIPKDKIEKIVDELAAIRKNIVLIGMPGCGKSTVSSLLGEALSREVVDTDSLIVENESRLIPEIFSVDGEDYFRTAETKAVADCTKKSSLVIATGGGAVLKEENRYYLKQNSFVIWLKRDFTRLAMEGRPLSKSLNDIKKIEQVRTPIYSSLADVEIEVDDDPQVTLSKILEAIKGEIR
ncbi:MAG: shikimate kinase [Clostridia bacterium]|nr:shikimate kinase [Clostridia bacterium]